MIRCPDSELHPDGEPAVIVGCGQVIEDASPDSEGMVDCPHCGIWFHISEGVMRKEFELKPEQLQALLDASKPVPYMVIGGSVGPSQQENANAAWAKLGTELGFDPMSVKPVAGKGIEFFTAEVTSDANRSGESTCEGSADAAR